MSALITPLLWMFGIFLSGYLDANILVFILAGFFLIVVAIILQFYATITRKQLPCIDKLKLLTLMLLLVFMGGLYQSRYELDGYRRAVHLTNMAPESVSGVIASDVTRYDDTCYFYLQSDFGLKISVKIRTSLPLAVGHRVTLWEPELMPVNPRNSQIADTKMLLGNDAFLYATFPYRAKAEILSIENKLLFQAALWRQNAAELFQRKFSKEISGFLTALLSSDKSGLPDGLYDDFITTGSVHIIVVSGMHFNYLANAVVLLLGLLCRNYRKKLLITLPVLVVFACFTGGTLPVLRAFLMISVSLFCDLFYVRKINSRAVIFILAGCFLGKTPTLIYNPSFLLSFGAAAGIAMFQPYFSQKLDWIPNRFLKDYLALHFSVQIFTAPVICYFFARFSRIAILTNLLVAPLVAPLLLLGTALLLLQKIPLVASLLVFCLKHTSGLFLCLVKLTAKTNAVSRLSLNETAFFCLLTSGCLFFFFLQIKKKKRKFPVILLLCISCLGSIQTIFFPTQPERMLITFLGAKNTNSAVIITPENRHILYGNFNDIFYGKSGAAFRNDSYIPLMILTEIPNPDYLAEFLKEYQVGTIATLPKYRSSLSGFPNMEYIDSNKTISIDSIFIRLTTDGIILFETEFCYADRTLSFSSDATYIYETLIAQPDKTLMLNLKRNGKTAEKIYVSEVIPKIYSKKELHPTGTIYDNFSILQVDQNGIHSLQPAEKELLWN